MELKRGHQQPPADTSSLLIVPYGIETLHLRIGQANRTAFNRTLWNWNICCKWHIGHKKAFNRTLWNWNSCKQKTCKKIRSFNRTLWNWNEVTSTHYPREYNLLIVPYGIETISRYWQQIDVYLLIVPYGIETSLKTLIRSTSMTLLIVPYGIETYIMLLTK